MAAFASFNETYNPFVNTPRVRGQNWTLPPLPQIPKQIAAPGYGCFQDVLGPYGYLLDFTGTGYNDNASTVPLPVTTENACRPGFFCPYLNIENNATWPVVCPANSGCFFKREYGLHCTNPQGVFEPFACPGGFYCPSYNEIIPCPAGFYCTTGSTTPTPCEFLSLCPIGTTVQQHYGILLICGLIDALLIFAYFVQSSSRLRNFIKSRLYRKPVEKEEAGLLSRQEIRQKISDGFNKMLQGRTDVKIAYEFENLGHTLPDGRKILRGISGEIKSGKMTAIFGPSGAGKTTFMNMLMGKIGRSSGTLNVNGAIPETLNAKKLIGYVPQDNIMIEELTVYENIWYSARTRLPNSWSDKEVKDYVDVVLEALNLTQISHERIGTTLERGISGGQRKRVNIGIEIAAAPLAVFLDEPTSGLDSTIAMDVIEILSEVSNLGMTVICAIHQPRVEIFELFDDVLMICPGGFTAYFGPANGAKPYFEDLGFLFNGTNNADTLMDIMSGRGELRPNVPATQSNIAEVIASWNLYVENNKHGNATTLGKESAGIALNEVAAYRGAAFWKQILLAHNRSITQQIRLFSAFFLESFVGLVAGAVMGISANAAGGELFSGFYIFPYVTLSPAPRYWILGMYGMLTGISIAVAATPAGVKVFGEEKPVYIREFEAGHNSLAYFLGKNLSIIYRIALSSAHFVSLYYFLAQPPIPIGLQYLLIFLNFFGVYGLGMIISMILRRENSTLVAVVFVLLLEAVCGFGPSLTDATNDGYVIILDMGLNRWMAEAQFGLWIEPYYQTIDFTLASQSYGYKFGNTAKNMWIMFGLGIGYRILALLAFLWAIHIGNITQRWAKIFFVCLLLFVLSLVLLFTV